jgi:hypothetical protein
MTLPRMGGETVRRRKRREQGAAIIEACLTLIIFLTMVFSLFDFGFSLFLHQTFVHQARTGARYGAINPGDLSAIKNVVLYNHTTGSGNGVMGLSPASVSVARNGTPGNRDDRIAVTISGYGFSFVTPGWAGNKTGKPISVVIPVEN